jgi:hypothetical protein
MEDPVKKLAIILILQKGVAQFPVQRLESILRFDDPAFGVR